MIKKIFFTFLLCLVSNCGYDSIYSKKNLKMYDFSINKIDFTGDKTINIKLKQKLFGYYKIERNKNYTLNINTSSNREIISKNAKGEILIFQNTVEIIVHVNEGDALKTKFKFIEKFKYPNKIDKFQLTQYEKQIKNSVAENIAGQLISKITTLK